MTVKLKDVIPTGVITGDDVMKLLQFAKRKGFALPAVNCTSSSTVNATLEAAQANNSPVIIQVSNGGSTFFAGKGYKSKKMRQDVAGSVAAAYHVRAMAQYYDIPVILHTDHCPKQHIDWLTGLIEEDEKYAAKNGGIPLFSSHMIDYSAEPDEENIAKTREILEQCAPLGILLEMEIGVTGGEEDGQNNEGVENTKLYSTPEDVVKVYTALNDVVVDGRKGMYSVAAAFGNVHGVYKVDAKLKPENLAAYQEGVRRHIAGGKDPNEAGVEEKPLFLVFHGGSGSKPEVIKEAVSYGVVKMNIDTDTQWAYWDGVRNFDATNHERLQQQVGVPGKSLEEDDKPNKKLYDPRNWLRKAEVSMAKRLDTAFENLNSKNSLDLVYDV